MFYQNDVDRFSESFPNYAGISNYDNSASSFDNKNQGYIDGIYTNYFKINPDWNTYIKEKATKANQHAKLIEMDDGYKEFIGNYFETFRKIFGGKSFNKILIDVGTMHHINGTDSVKNAFVQRLIEVMLKTGGTIIMPTENRPGGSPYKIKVPDCLKPESKFDSKNVQLSGSDAYKDAYEKHVECTYHPN